MNKTDAIKAMLTAKTHADLADLYNHDMECQCNVAQGDGTQHTKESGKGVAYSDMEGNTWSAFRIPYNAMTDPVYEDKPVTFSLLKHAESIGLTGWDWRNRVSRWVAFDFDSMTGHEKAGISTEEMDRVKTHAQALPYVATRRSTSGSGLHLYVFFADPVPTENHTVHATLARAVLEKMGSDCGYDFSTAVDKAGGIMWVWHRKMEVPGCGGLDLIKAAEKGLDGADIPQDWRAGYDLSAHGPNVSGVVGKLDADHLKVMEYLRSVGAVCEWDEKLGLLRTHTESLGHAHNFFNLAGNYSAPSAGTGLDKANCFAYPHKGGAWLVISYGKSEKPDPWWTAKTGKICAWLNREEKRFTYTDQGNADLLIERHGDIIRFCPTLGGWMFFDGKRWQSDAEDKVYMLAVNVILSLKGDIHNLPNDKMKDALRQHIHNCGADGRVKSMLSATSNRCKVQWTQFDHKPWLLNCQNGTVDLRTGILRPHDPKDLITQISPYRYNPDAECTMFLAGLDLLWPGDAEMLTFIHRLIGYCMSGDVATPVLPLLYGPSGRNGKSQLVNIISGILGEYAGVILQSTLSEKGSSESKTDLASNWNKRFLTCQETDKDGRLSASTIKTLTGEDQVKCRFLYKGHFEYTPQFKVWISTNHLPEIPKGGDPSLWTRLISVQFDKPIPVEKRNPHYAQDVLKGEGEGVLAWAVRGCVEFFADREKHGEAGNPLAIPPRVIIATSEYQLSQDDVLQFVKDECILETGEFLGVNKDLYPAFQRYQTEGQLTFLSKGEFKKRFATIQGVRVGRTAWDRGFCGVRFKTDEEKGVSLAA